MAASLPLAFAYGPLWIISGLPVNRNVATKIVQKQRWFRYCGTVNPQDVGNDV